MNRIIAPHGETAARRVEHAAVRHIATMLFVVAVLFLHSCSNAERKAEVNSLNTKAYDFHYRNLDSAEVYARKALEKSDRYNSGKAEAYNNLAFVNISRMKYKQAGLLLDSVRMVTDNQIELLVADVQMMRLCQRKSENKDFYKFNQSALARMNRLSSEVSDYSEREYNRIVYARTEYAIVASTYFYYVGLKEQSRKALAEIDPNGDINHDMGQLLNYLYNVGSGGIINYDDKAEVEQEEFYYLIRCHALAVKGGYIYFEANALQAISEHLDDADSRNRLISTNKAAVEQFNIDNVTNDLLAGNLALRSLELFKQFGDIYQIAGAYRTLAECYWNIGDYKSALDCLYNALESDKAIEQAPDLVASIREQLSLTYSALNDKPKSDYNRNVYLDMQEKTRQDRQLEARAEGIEQSSNILNAMLIAVVTTIVIVVLMMFVFDRMRRRNDRKFSIDKLLEPLKEWESRNVGNIEALDAMRTAAEERLDIQKTHMFSEKKRNLEQRAKVSLSNSIMPLIDRMANEVERLSSTESTEDVKKERLDYINELAAKINDYNQKLTSWIQMRQGSVSLHIESFKLQPLFDIVKKERTEFASRGVKLKIDDTALTVKADKTLTLFMINTMTDNARKFTTKGDSVRVYATEKDDSVEISIVDTGKGMDEKQLQSLFAHTSLIPSAQPSTAQDSTNLRGDSHGFGLLNCKGIIEKYRKLSHIFRVCDIGAESEVGQGSRFFFRIPKGIKCLLIFFMISLQSFATAAVHEKESELILNRAKQFADSAYFSNLRGAYHRTVEFADSCISCLNEHHRLICPKSSAFMSLQNSGGYAELEWFDNDVSSSYSTILDVRNETAVAALALHDWQLYNYNNTAYTSLFRKCSADANLFDYVKVMQESEINKNISIILLTLLLLSLFPAYYLLYYRNRLYYNFCLDKVAGINNILRSGSSDRKMISEIEKLWKNNPKKLKNDPRMSMLNSVVDNIEQTLRRNMSDGRNRRECIEVINDECRKMKMETDKLYVSNSVLDNCLSSLKHETMFYPSRIQQLVNADSGADINSLKELLSYYKDLYSILSMQAMRQTDRKLGIDAEMLRHLFSLLNDTMNADMSAMSVDENCDPLYVKLSTTVRDGEEMNKDVVSKLFSFDTPDVRLLTCRQITRELGEEQNARGCGIESSLADDGSITINIIITKRLWKSLKF